MAITSIPDKVTGKAGYILYNGTQLPIRRWNARVTRNMADCTDSSDYDSNADMVGRTQIPTSAILEASIEGCYRRSSTAGVIIANLFTGITAVPCVLGIDQNTPFGSGTVDITDYNQDSPLEDVVSFTCNIRSNGLFIPSQ
jgi:hypothetical protein